MAKPKWYVVQVTVGREQQMCELIERVVLETNAKLEERGTPIEDLLIECFSPHYLTRRKRDGEWHDEQKNLLPGYVVAVTGNPWELGRLLWSVREFTRIVTVGETFVPLQENEKAWIEDWTRKGERTIPMSIAYKQGDAVVVTEGPLKGREGMITKINRRKCLAFIELVVNGKRVTTAVGLAVLPDPKVAQGEQPSCST